MIALACWASLGLLVTVVHSVKAGNPAKQNVASTAPETSSTDKLIHKIGVTYYNHGYRQKAIDEIKDNLYDQCDRMQPTQCADFLQKSLLEAQNAPDLQ